MGIDTVLLSINIARFRDLQAAIRQTAELSSVSPIIEYLKNLRAGSVTQADELLQEFDQLEDEGPKMWASSVWCDWRLRVFHALTVTGEFNLTGWRFWKSVASDSETVNHLVAAGGLEGESVEAELGEDAILLNRNIAITLCEEIELICKARGWESEVAEVKEFKEFAERSRVSKYSNIVVVYW